MIELESKIYIIDDLFTPQEIEFVKDKFTGPDFDWYFGFTADKTVSNDTYSVKADSNTYEQFQLVHWFIVNGKWTPTKFSSVIKLIFSRVARRLGNTALKVERVKANLQTRTLSQGRYNTPHTDSPVPGYFVAIYYVDNSDGGTTIFSNTEPPFVVERCVESKAGRVLVMDGKYFHAGCHPRESDYRMVINFNFRV
jgi:hypothetical protein